MTDYNFRLRFNLANAYRIGSDAEEIDLLVTPTKQRLRLRTAVSGTPIKDNSRAVVLGGPYTSPNEAMEAGEQAKKALLYWAVEQRLGIDLGDGRQRSVVTDAGLAMFQQQWGAPVRNDVHGIDVYEAIHNLRFAFTNMTPVVGKNPLALVETFNREFREPMLLTEKQRLAAEIYSGSFFDVSHRSRFITLVTAVEALLEPSRRSESAQTLVSEIENITRSSDVDNATQNAILSSLQWLRFESIGQTGRSLAKRLIPERQYGGRTSWSFFTYCYQLRSQILHRGGAEDDSADLLGLANETEGFVAYILLASLRQGAA